MAGSARSALLGAWRRIPRPVRIGGAVLAALLLAACVVVVVTADRLVVRTMNGRRWSLPTRVYSDAWALHVGDGLRASDVERRLLRLRYVALAADTPLVPGSFLVEKGRIRVSLNDRESPWGRTPGVAAVVTFSGARVAGIRRIEDGERLSFLAFEPEVVGSVFDQKMEDRTLVRLEQVPQVVLDAILTTEDRDFFGHTGISFRRIAGAAFRNLFGSSRLQGGSTLTQQLVKNMFLTHERTLRRKLNEAVLAILVESRYSKDEILEAYLNEIYLGQRGSVSVTGVEEASRYYFGKSVWQLELHEAALLAGLIASPGRYSPFRNPERALQRRAFVLGAMLETGKIDRASHDAAVAAPLTRVTGPPTGVQAPHFVDFVLNQLKESRASLSQDGLSIYTTLDPDLQALAFGSVQKGLEELEGKYKRLRPRPGVEPLQGALIALDPRTGSIRAFVGGRDYQTSQFNRVVQARRQPGSLFKPFVYLAALSRRDLVPPITAATIVQDSPISLLVQSKDGDTWTPRNYDGEFRGPVTVRRALQESLNIPTVRVAVTEVEAGETLLPDIIQAARRAGITSTMRPYPSLALGAFEITPLEIAASYATFANGGYRVHPRGLLGVASAQGTRVEVEPKPLVAAADPEALSVLVSLLQGVVNDGTARAIRLMGIRGILAGKTGTTNDGRDAWFIGFSPHLLVAVWVGYDDNRGLNLSGAMAALPIFIDFIRQVPAHNFQVPFPDAPGLVRAEIDPESGGRATPSCPTPFLELFLPGTEPTEPCPIHAGGFFSPPSEAGGPPTP